ncbi:MAG: hypothetical protein K2N84_06295 [Clostridia bacterium]|nr:hypothetical protein [Clostridia bacterium]
METLELTRTKEKNALYALAKDEPPFPADDLLQEIAPLLEDYFVAQVGMGTHSVTLFFPNGQKLKLTAQVIR